MNKLTNFFKMLSDETRLRIIVLLAQQRLCVCEICGVLDLPQPKVSKHLAKLRDKGFVKDERKEHYIFYTLNIEDKEVFDLIKKIVASKEKYYQLKVDSERLKHKYKFLNQCKTGLINNKNIL